MTEREIVRREAILEVLRRPDAPDLPRRAFRYRYAGRGDADLVKLQLERAYIRHRIALAGIVEESIGAVRRYSLRIVERRRA